MGSTELWADSATSCAICKRQRSAGVVMRNNGTRDGLRICCPKCGEYEVIGSDAIQESYQWPDEMRGPLACATRQAFDAGRPLALTQSNVGQLANLHSHTRVSDNQFLLLQRIAKKIKRPQHAARLWFDNDFTIADLLNREELAWHLDYLKAQGLVTLGYLSQETVDVQLTINGWERVQPAPRLGGLPGQCFVAMWFDTSMTEAYEQGIAKAVTDCAFSPLRIDEKQHNNQITDEIMAGIRDSQFVVADFTGNRQGVYYEAGFAHGLGRPVIYCCRESDLKGVHFDTRQINHVVWSHAGELRERLRDRIKATIVPVT